MHKKTEVQSDLETENPMLQYAEDYIGHKLALCRNTTTRYKYFSYAASSRRRLLPSTGHCASVALFNTIREKFHKVGQEPDGN
jgi:hypothetical protein